MVLFEMVKYHARTYPSDIPLRREEVAAHFDVATIKMGTSYSLHTEYSYGKRALNSNLISKFPVLMEAQKGEVPQLWKSPEWASAFAQFIFELAGNQAPPAVIEVHPPFSDYTDMANFIKIYSIFEQMVTEALPGTEILVENRCGSIYRGGKFIISKQKDMEELCECVERNGLKLKIAFDIPQLYTAHNAQIQDKYIRLMELMEPLRPHIGGVHLWGKRKSSTGRKISHCGDLNSYFENDTIVKTAFLRAFTKCFDDGIARKLVLEVNSGDGDLLSIIKDLQGSGVEFI